MLGRSARRARRSPEPSAPPTPAGTDRPAIEIVDVTKTFPAETKRGKDVTVVRDLSLTIGEGEFFSLLGPSGCGKSTTLRMLAGFEEPTQGRILLRGQDVTGLRPARRDLNMVFQAYALFPHLTVAENVAFGLRVKRVRGAEVGERVTEALRAVRLEGHGDRRPAQLSGGQQQRVALARALVNRPAALLLDEPLGALDLKLREEMQGELKAIQHRTGTTFVYVTHDQDEALTMSDRIAVMNAGVIDQVAAPRHLYERPATPFVAGFIGTSNLVDFRADEVRGDHAVMQLGEHGHIQAPVSGRMRRGDAVQITVRPEKICLSAPTDDAPCSCVHARVLDVVYRGSVIELIAELPGRERLTVRHLNTEETDAHAPGDEVALYWRRHHSFIVGAPDEDAPAAPAPAVESRA